MGIEKNSDLNFLKYMNELSEKSFVETLTMEYLSVKGIFRECKPLFDTRVSIEFTLVLLLWDAIKPYLKIKLDKYGPLALNLADFIGCAFMGMPDYEWSQRANEMIVVYGDIISYADWFEAFRILETKFMSFITSMPYCYGDNIVLYMDEMAAYNNYYFQEFVPKYNMMSSMRQIIDYYKKKGLNFKEIDFNISN